MINVIYKKDLTSSEIFDTNSLWIKHRKLKTWVGFIYNFKNEAEPESSGYVGQSGEGINFYDISLSVRPSQFRYFPSDFTYAGEKVNKKRRELPWLLWRFEALAVVEADTRKELKDLLNELEEEFILNLDSVENGYNSNYGGKHGYKYKWKCYKTKLPKLKDIFHDGYSLSSQGIDLSSNPEVYVFPRDRVKNIDMEYIRLDNFKTRFDDLPELTRDLIQSFKEKPEIPKDNNNLYLFKCHIDSLWILYSCKFSIINQDGKKSASISFKVHTEYHPTLKKIYGFLSEDNIPKYIERNGWNTYEDTVLFVEKDKDNNYIFHHFKTIKDAAKYTKRDYQAAVGAVKNGLGGFLKLPGQSYCRKYFGNQFIKEYLSNY